MAVQPQPEYVRAARQRWPQATVTGDGEWALVSYCCEAKYVRLYSLYMMAATDCHEHCGHAFCRKAHRVFRITPAPAIPATRPFRNPADMERD
ncbi:MAG: hypothetical protein ACE14M_10995 [Terriglobales bacterium]